MSQKIGTMSRQRSAGIGLPNSGRSYLPHSTRVLLLCCVELTLSHERVSKGSRQVWTFRIHQEHYISPVKEPKTFPRVLRESAGLFLSHARNAGHHPVDPST